MAKFKNIQKGFLMRNAIRFWGNVVRNYDKEINDEEFFNLVHYCMDRNTMVKMIQEFFSKEDLEKLANPDTYRHLDLVSDSSGVVLQKIWNAEGFRKRARVLLLKICDAMMETYAPPGDHAADELEERFNALVRFLALSKLEAEVLMFAYVRHATVFSTLPGHACGSEIRVFFAMAIDRAYDEVVRVMGKGGKLYKYECLDSCHEFMADELGGYLAGNDNTSLAEHFYLESKTDALPWDFFGKLAVNEGKTLKELLKANGAGRLNILLYGSAGTGKTSFARSLLSELGLSAYEIPLFSREDSRARTLENRLACIRVCNDNVVGKKGVIIVDEADAILRTSSEGLMIFSDERMSTEKGAVNSLLDELKMPVIWISNIHPHEMAESVRRRFDFAVSFKALSRTQREMIWRNNIKRLDIGSLVDDELLTRCAARYETNAGGITMVLESVRKMNPPKDKVEALIERLMKPHCELMLKRIDDGRSEPAKDYSLDGLNIKGDIPLESLVKAARNFLSREDRGVDFPRMNILLWGPPGTGKSEFVKFLSCELGRRHVVKMGGDLLSKWVGGSEENIKAAFEEAEYDNTILFFDEIDGLLRDRAGAERSWEVTQVNELLYRMENFNGIFIGATNRNDSLDPAVLRRFTFKVEFDALDTVGKQKFFERTFGTQLSAGERTRLHEIENVTPGDFRTVRQRLFYLGGEVDNEMRIMAIEQECANKRAFHRGRIGF